MVPDTFLLLFINIIFISLTFGHPAAGSRTLRSGSSVNRTSLRGDACKR